MTIQRWDANTGQRVGEPLRGHTDGVKSKVVAFSPDSHATGRTGHSLDRVNVVFNHSGRIPLSKFP